MLTVTELWQYSVKSLRGNRLQSARLTDTGFEWDRYWMVVDTKGAMVTQRTVPRMAVLTAHVFGDVLKLTDPARPLDPCRVPTFWDCDPQDCDVRVWSDTVRARPAHPAATAWLRRVLGVECTLVSTAPGYGRVTKVGTPAFADDAPITIASEASLAALNATLPQPVTMERFRPNIIVEGGDAWAEETWDAVRVGSVLLRTPKRCKRCSMLDVDPQTGTVIDGVHRGLGALRAPDGGPPLFAVKATHGSERGTIALGDVVVAESAR